MSLFIAGIYMYVIGRYRIQSYIGLIIQSSFSERSGRALPSTPRADSSLRNKRIQRSTVSRPWPTRAGKSVVILKWYFQKAWGGRKRKEETTPDYAFRNKRLYMTRNTESNNPKAEQQQKSTKEMSTTPVQSSSSSWSLDFFFFLGSSDSCFCQTWFAASLSTSVNRISDTSEYQLTGWPSIPSLMF